MDNSTVDLTDLKAKIIDKLRPSGWANKLKGFLVSSEFDEILQFLYTQRNLGKRFTPPVKDLFTAFEKCEYSKLRVVIVAQDPYTSLGEADGMSFSCSKTGKTSALLQYIHDATNKTIENNLRESDRGPDLSYLAEQGVLLLNSALSVEIDKSGTHTKIWRPFMAYLFDMLNSMNTNLVFIYIGKKAQDLHDLIDEDRHHKLYATHPANAAANNQAEWNSNNVFKDANNLLIEHNKNGIKW